MADHPNITRRVLVKAFPFVGVAAAVAVGTLASCEILPAVAAHPDAELLALGERFKAQWARERKLSADAEGKIDDKEFDRLWQIECDRAEDIHQMIRKQRATTLEGLKVKAMVVSWCHGGDRVGFGETTDQQFGADIVNDLLAA